jgi:hypothetical protein
MQFRKLLSKEVSQYTYWKYLFYEKGKYGDQGIAQLTVVKEFETEGAKARNNNFYNRGISI